jgi:Xaa-Pro aminopeptidase
MNNPAQTQAAEARIATLRAKMQAKAMDALLITHLPTIRYLTGFAGSYATLFITHSKILFLTNDLYAEQIKTQLFPLKGMEKRISRDPLGQTARENLLENPKTLGFEQDKVSYAMALQLRKLFRPARLVQAAGMAQQVTIPKTSAEIELVATAAKITDEVFQSILPLIKPGVSEQELATEIAYQGRKRGAEKEAFDIIVVSGARSAMPHGRASEKKLENGDMITFDFGFYYQGFASDMTRTVALGNPGQEQKKVYELIRSCVEAANQAAKPGMTGKELDAIARDKIEQAGYGQYFQHSLGHGLGIEVHEAPAISHRNEKGIIPEYAIITIEPGIYLPGSFGVRIEDDICVQASGAVVLTHSPKELLIL